MKKFYAIIICLLASTTFAQNWRYNNYDVWSDGWNNNSQHVSVYNTAGQPDTVFGNSYQDEAYSPFNRTNFIYNSSDQLIEKTTVGLAGTDSRQRSYYTYNQEGNLSVQTDEQWNNGVWGEVNRSVLSYNANGTLASKLDQFPLGDGSYENLHKLENTYDADTKLTEMMLSVFESGEWVPAERISYTYDAGGKTSISLSQHFVEGIWKNSRQQEYIYNSDNSLSAIHTDRWTEAEVWGNFMKSDFSYDAEGIRNLEVVSIWEGSWENFSRRRFENDPSVLSIEEFGSQFSLYPNPVTDKLNIVSAGSDAVAVTFVDLTGKVVLAVDKGPETGYVSTENLPAGVYNVVISSQKGTFTKRIVKI